MQQQLICLTCPELAGGWGRIIVNLANTFHAEGYRVHVLLERAEGPFLDLLQSSIEIKTLKTTHLISGIPFLGAYLIRHRPAVLLTPIVRHTVLALQARRLTSTKTRIFANIHSTYGQALKRLQPAKREARLKRISKFYIKCDGIICVSEGVKEDFCSLTGIQADKVTTIYNPIVTEDIGILANEEVEHPWFNEDQPPVIISVGRLEEPKNFQFLIETFEIVRQRKNCRLVIVGEGNDRSILESRIFLSPHFSDIQLLGNQINPYKYVRRAKVFVLSSLWEGLPTVVVEAMALGTPVVSTDCPSGPREILEDGRLGHLVPLGDVTALADSILETLDHPTPKELLFESADRFNALRMGRRYLDVLGFCTPDGT